MILFLDIIVLH